MAIYTQFGRYEKARAFKHWTDNNGDVYMLLGFGNPKWDSTDSGDASHAAMPVAPYNTSVILKDSDKSDPLASNQFFDDKVNMSFIDATSVESALITGAPNTSSNSGKYIDKCKNLVPPFPCWWSVDSPNNSIVFSDDNNQDVPINLNNYSNYYITESSNIYTLHETGEPDKIVVFPTGDTTEDAKKRQYFSELYLRGLAIEKGICHPACLLGAVKCSVDFVRDIGNDESVYTGELDQFWYGDRYWEVVNIDDGNEVDGYINDDKGRSILPCHLAFTATIPPMFLCGNINIDQNLSPRQIAIFTRNRETVIENVGGESVERIVPGPNYYRIDTNIFNFGQYSKSGEPSTWSPSIPSGMDNKILNFTLPCTVNNKVYPYNSDGTDFKFLLGDYLRGSIKNIHSAERIGYVVGF